MVCGCYATVLSLQTLSALMLGKAHSFSFFFHFQSVASSGCPLVVCFQSDSKLAFLRATSEHRNGSALTPLLEDASTPSLWRMSSKSACALWIIPTVCMFGTSAVAFAGRAFRINVFSLCSVQNHANMLVLIFSRSSLCSRFVLMVLFSCMFCFCYVCAFVFFAFVIVVFCNLV